MADFSTGKSRDLETLESKYIQDFLNIGTGLLNVRMLQDFGLKLKVNTLRQQQLIPIPAERLPEFREISDRKITRFL